MKRATSPPERGRADQRGIALVAAILLLLLTSVLAATFVATTTSERAISSNVHVARASLVSADAGVRVAQQIIANVGKAKLDSCSNAWAGNGLVVTNFNLFKSGPYTVTSTNPPFSATATVAFEDTTLVPNGSQAQMYDYAYTITATGGFGAAGSRSVQSQGILRLSVEKGNFSNYLVFTNTHLTPGGGAIWFSSGTRFDGRVHTNGEFRFAYQPVFQDLVTSVNQKAWYNNKGNPVELNASYNSNIDVPSFFGGFQRNQPTVTLPANSYSQQGAALNSALTGLASTPTNNQLNLYCRGITSGSALPTGVYIPNDGSASPVANGGIYVQGSVDSLYMFPSGANQVYHFRQGTTMTVITVGPGGTSVWQKVGSSLATMQSYLGSPDGSMYVNGGISMLGGPTRTGSTVNPALQSSTQLTITATSDIVVQRDITYQDYNNGDNVLGLYSSGGNIRVGANAPNDCNLDAYVMATGTNAAFQVDNYSSGSTRGTFHLRGGMVASYYGAFGTFDANTGQSQTGYNRDFHYDKRGKVPPYYPSTNRYSADIPAARTLSWKEM